MAIFVFSFIFKQKTAYEMRISDWSSDVCSSDLRGRVRIPIRDPRGRVIAFGGRVIGDGEPKYLNSPETPLFDPGRTLYNLDRAAPAARKTGRVLVVEGHMNVIGLAGAGIHRESDG